MESGEIFVLALAGATFYMFLRFRLMQAAQPYRIELARRGEAILADPRLSLHHKNHVRFMLDSAFSRIVAPIAVVALPFVVLALMFSRKLRERSRAVWRVSDEDLRKEVEEVDRLFTRSIAMTSPLLAIVLLLERAVLLSLAALVRYPIDVVDIAADKAYSMYRAHCA